MDEVLGAVAVSLRREKVPQTSTMGSANGNQSETFIQVSIKVENILKCSLDLIPSPSPLVKIQIMGGKVCLRYKDKTLLGIVNKHLKTKSLLTSPSNLLPFPPII